MAEKILKQSIYLSACLFMTSVCFSETWTVDDDGADYPQADFDSIQYAVNAAS